MAVVTGMVESLVVAIVAAGELAISSESVKLPRDAAKKHLSRPSSLSYTYFRSDSKVPAAESMASALSISVGGAMLASHQLI